MLGNKRTATTATSGFGAKAVSKIDTGMKPGVSALNNPTAARTGMPTGVHRKGAQALSGDFSTPNSVSGASNKM